jgi:YfiH family protein
LFHLDSDGIYRSDALGQISWLQHGFGTRSSAGWPDTTRLATVRQIHSNRVVVADQPGDLGEGDALVTNLPGLTLAIRTADCLPILMADTQSRAVAAVHAGWRGTAQQIVIETLQTMAKEFGTTSANVVIAIGPGIGPCCYEVGPDVASQFSELFPEIPGFGAAHAKLDLPEANLRQLRRNGGITGQMVASGLCTRCLPEQFHSFRRDREAAGRMVSAVAIR